MGISTIKNAKLSMDLDANVVQSGVIKGEPFPLSFKPTSRGVPDLTRMDNHPHVNQLSVYHNDGIKASDTLAPSAVPKDVPSFLEEINPKRVKFNDDVASVPLSKSEFNIFW